jgi:hypothetical protein
MSDHRAGTIALNGGQVSDLTTNVPAVPNDRTITCPSTHTDRDQALATARTAVSA